MKLVYGVKEYVGKALSVERPPLNLTVSVSDLNSIISFLMQSPVEIDKLFGFCLYLMLKTAARNKTIRTLKFDAFKQEEIEGEIYRTFYIKETKTQKGTGFFIEKHHFDYVQ